MFDDMLKMIGFNSLEDFATATAELIEEENRAWLIFLKEADTRRIKKFNKRKKQRRAYCGGRK
jgi:hypothetical protein